jgi:hypothetical protein
MGMLVERYHGSARRSEGSQEGCMGSPKFSELAATSRGGNGKPVATRGQALPVVLFKSCPARPGLEGYDHKNEPSSAIE